MERPYTLALSKGDVEWVASGTEKVATFLPSQYPMACTVYREFM